MAFEKYILQQDDDPKMALHLFIAVISEYLNGKKTALEAKTAIESHLGVTLSTNEALDLSNAVAYVDAGVGAAAKSRRLDELYRVLVLAEHDTWYDSLTLLRDRLNWSQPD